MQHANSQPAGKHASNKEEEKQVPGTNSGGPEEGEVSDPEEGELSRLEEGEVSSLEEGEVLSSL